MRLPSGVEWIIILAIVLIVFGARRLPDLAGSVGRSIREFRKGAEGALDTGDEDAGDGDADHRDAATPDRDAER